MSGLRFASFGAATMPLSKVVMDTDLQLYPYDANMGDIVASSIKAPVDPAGWTTETIPWPSDTDPSVLTTGEIWPTTQKITWVNNTGKQIEISIVVTNRPASLSTLIYVKADGTTIYTSDPVAPEETIILPPLWINDGETITLYNQSGKGIADGIIYNTGRTAPPETIDLTGKWLALNIDLMGLSATISIMGETIQYTNYPMYFPLRPESITITGTMTRTQNRPDIRGYL